MNERRWNGPWFDAIRPMLDAVGEDALAGRWQACIDRLNLAAQAGRLVNANGRPIRFVDASAIDAGAYESHVWLTGEVPTRTDAAGGWHDLFNALVWIAWPRLKAALNRLQAQAIEREGIGARRGALRDAATLFDENAALFVTANRGLIDALRAADWDTLFVARRDEFVRDVRVVAFGHALIDKLRAPYKAICAHAWIVEPGSGRAPGAFPMGQAHLAPDRDRDSIDARVAAMLDPGSLAARAFAPLPVLGIPGWWPLNRDPEFYRDSRVFRSRRTHRDATAVATQ